MTIPSIGEITKSVKALGVRDWLNVAWTIFGMALVVYVLFGLSSKLDAHVASAAPAIEGVQELRRVYAESVEIDKRSEARFDFMVCVIMAGNSPSERKVCVEQDSARRMREGR